MIPFKLQMIMLLISSAGFIIIINMIRKYRLDLKYAMLWLLLTVLVIVLVIFPKINFFISKSVGIEVPVNAIFLFGILFCFIILFSLTIALSRSTNKIKDLSQEVGILKKEIYDLIRIEHQKE